MDWMNNIILYIVLVLHSSGINSMVNQACGCWEFDLLVSGFNLQHKQP